MKLGSALGGAMFDNIFPAAAMAVEAAVNTGPGFVGELEVSKRTIEILYREQVKSCRGW